LDVSNLRVEDHGLPMHVAALVILEGAPLLDAAGQLRLDIVRGNVEQRLHLAPRLRQVLRQPHFGLGPPWWADDPSFDIRKHVQARPIPAPADEVTLLRVCSELNEGRLDRFRPLWEMWLLTGLADGNVGMLIRLHHVVADGIAAVAMIGGLFDPGPDPPLPSAALPSAAPPSAAPPDAVPTSTAPTSTAPPDALPPAAPPWKPAPTPSVWELLVANLRERTSAMTGALALLRRPSVVISRLRMLTRQARLLAHEGVAPQVSLNQPAGKHRRLLFVRADLGEVKAVAHAHGGKVNDVVLAAIAGGARRLLESRGELRPGLVLKASVAASVRGPADQQATGNLVGVILVPLPVGEPHPVRQLEEIIRATEARKRQPPYQPSARFAQRWMVRAMSHQRLTNLLVSDLPGPAAALYFAGARVLDLFQIGVVQGNITLSVGVLSYAGRLNFSIVGDADTTGDLAVFAAGLSETLEHLTAGDSANG